MLSIPDSPKGRAMKMGGMPNPKAFPTEGPRKTQSIAYDPDTFDLCGDPACNCRKSKWNTRGYGETEQEAIADFWEQWEGRSAA